MGNEKENNAHYSAQTDVADIADNIEHLREDIVEVFQKVASAEFFDKELGTTIKEAVSKLVKQVSNIEPPIVNIDLSQIEVIVKSINAQNENIISAISKIQKESNDKYNDLVSQTLEMVRTTNEFLRNGIAQIKEIMEANKKPQIDMLRVVRGENDLIKEVIPVYKT